MRNRETKRKLITCKSNQLDRQELQQPKLNPTERKNTTEIIEKYEEYREDTIRETLTGKVL